MRPLSFFRFLVLLLAFAVALSSTLYSQALWRGDDFFALLILAFLWLFVGIGWGMIQLERRAKRLSWRRYDWIFPVTLALVIVSGVIHLPLRLVFWTQRAALQATEQQLLHWPTKGDNKPTLAPPFNGHFAANGTVRPFQLAKSHGDTRFLLWDNQEHGTENATAIGLAYCPDDAGCSRAAFRNYWAYDTNDGKAEYVKPPAEYYWDYSHGATGYVSLGDGWYATRVSVDEIG